jgi:molybdopterin-guanine dinucleotide biosynthesis protein A
MSPDTLINMLDAGGVVLTGGKSTRMGQSKAHLPFGDELMLQRVVRLLGEVLTPIVVVGAPGQALPALPKDVTIVRDELEDRGPLQGIAAGLGALQGRCDCAFVCGCDVPLLRPAYVRRMLELGNDHDIAVPYVDGFYHALAAVYRIDVLEHVTKLLAEDRRRPAYLFDMTATRLVQRDELLDADPQLNSLGNCNRPEDYQAALQKAGLNAK